MKTVLCISLLTLVSMQALGGSEKVDSLKQLLEQHTTADKAEVLWGIAYELFDVDNAQALFYAERAYHDVWKRGDSLQIVKVGTTYGQMLRRMGKLDHSIDVSSRMLPIAKRHEYRKYWKMLLNSLGVAYIDKARYDIALDFSYQSLGLREEDGDTIELAVAYQNIGLIFSRVDDWDRSLEYSARSILLLQSIPRATEASKKLLTTGIGNVASMYYEKGQFHEAIAQFRNCMRVEGSRRVPASFAWTFASAFLEIGYLDSAKHYGIDAIARCKISQNYFAQALSYILLSRIMLAEGDMRRSSQFLDSARLVVEPTGYTSLGYEVLKQRLRLLVMSKSGDEVIKTLNTYEKYGDSLVVLNGESRMKSLEVAFTQRENEAKLRAQTAIMQLQEASLDRQQTFILIVSGLLVLLLFLAVALSQSNKQKQEINQMLDRIVEARTNELSKHRDALQHLIDEENGRRSRATAELMGMFHTLKGLLHLIKVDPDKRGNDYLEKAMELTQQMEVVSHKHNEQSQRKPQIPTM